MAASSDESRLNPAAPEFFPSRTPNPNFRRHLFPLPQYLSFRLTPLPPLAPHILSPSNWPRPAGTYPTRPVELFRNRQQFRCGSNHRMSGGWRNPPPPRPPRMRALSWRPRSRQESSGADDEVYTRIVEHRDYHSPGFRKERRKKPLKPGHSTVMICNIPNKRKMLIEFLDEHCIKENNKLLDNQPDDHGSSSRGVGVTSAYDFLYLPFDLSRKLNLGYAFVNFTHPGAVEKFKWACHNKSWQHFGSRKICELAAASLQGKAELMNHFEKVGFACDEEEFLPVSFSSPGRGSGMPVSQSTVGILMKKKPTPTSSSSSSSSPLPT